MLVDQAPERERAAIRVPFLGAPAWVDLSPALCAMRARAPLVAAFPRRLDDGSHTIDITAILLPPARPSRAWAVEAMTEVTRQLEAFIRRHPDQWLWMHRRWKGTPERRRPEDGNGNAQAVRQLRIHHAQTSAQREFLLAPTGERARHPPRRDISADRARR